MRQNPPAPAANVPVTVIGVVRSAHTEPETTPIQAALNRAGRAAIEIAEPYRDGLAGLDGFGYAWLLTWLHRPGGRKDAGDRKEPGAREGRAGREGREGGPPLRQVPFLLRRQQREMGIFATRGPRRVNPIGLSLIQLLEVTPETVLFAGVDVIDGTPVIDLKPYVTRFDRPPGDPRCGWFDEVALDEGSTPAGLARPEPPARGPA
jgi:tRNA (Thr-GGU) A37 N-methylase